MDEMEMVIRVERHHTRCGWKSAPLSKAGSREEEEDGPHALCLGLLLTQGIKSFCIVACLYVPRSC